MHLTIQTLNWYNKYTPKVGFFLSVVLNCNILEY